MNSEQLEKLKRLIKTSTVLSDFERVEWEQSLPIMNDKQLSELVQILSTTSLIQEQKKSEVVDKGPLGHIGNLPNTNAQIKPAFLDNLTSSADKVVEKPVQKPPMPPVPPVRLPGNLAQAAAGDFMIAPEYVGSTDTYVKTPNTKSDHTFNVPGSNHELEPLVDTQKTVKEENHLADLGPTTIANLQDLSRLTPEWLRNKNDTDIITILKEMVADKDYMPTVLALEKSPLYQTYLSIGKTMLSGKDDFKTLTETLKKQDKEYLTQTDFERFADILASLQVN